MLALTSELNYGKQTTVFSTPDNTLLHSAEQPCSRQTLAVCLGFLSDPCQSHTFYPCAPALSRQALPRCDLQAHMKPSEEEDEVLDALGTLASFAR